MSKKKKRVFVFEDQEFADPGPGFSDEDVLKQIATFLPSLAGGKAERKELDDGTIEVTLSPKPKRLG